MALLDLDDVKVELQMDLDSSNTSYDLLLQVLLEAIINIWEELTDRTWEFAEFTEYHGSDGDSSTIFLKNYPVSSSANFSLYEDVDWEWNADDLIEADDYRVDYEAGIIHYSGTFDKGKENVKVVYSAGYTYSTLPASIKQVIIRQIAVWFKQAKDQKWHVATQADPAGGGSISFSILQQNLLPEFILLAERHRRLPA